MLITIFLKIINSTSLTVPTQPSPRFHVEAWLPFRNREMDYCVRYGEPTSIVSQAFSVISGRAEKALGSSFVENSFKRIVTTFQTRVKSVRGISGRDLVVLTERLRGQCVRAKILYSRKERIFVVNKCFIIWNLF